MNASSIMTTEVTTLTINNTVGDAVNLFFKKRVRQVPIIDGDMRVVGVVTPRFLMRSILPGYISEGYLKDVRFAPELKQFIHSMEGLRSKPLDEFVEASTPVSPDYAFVSPETSTMEIAAIFVNTERFVDRILVVDDKKRLLGIISPVDVFKSLWEHEKR